MRKADAVKNCVRFLLSFQRNLKWYFVTIDGILEVVNREILLQRYIFVFYGGSDDIGTFRNDQADKKSYFGKNGRA